jgi:hypothetical protein
MKETALLKLVSCPVAVALPSSPLRPISINPKRLSIAKINTIGTRVHRMARGLNGGIGKCVGLEEGLVWGDVDLWGFLL